MSASVSVVIPAYNRESTIGVTLDSLLAQSHSGWEAIVVNDGSSDGTEQIVTGYAERDQRIRLYSQPNSGVSGARNSALALARHPWVLFLDADDWMRSDALSLMLGALERNRADLVYTGCMLVLADGTEVPYPAPPIDGLFLSFARTCAFSIHTCIVKTELARAVGGFDETLVACEDWDLWQRVTRTMPTVARIPDLVAYYLIRPESASRSARQILTDGLKVVERGHATDPRLAGWPGPLERGARPELLSSARLYLTAYAAALALAAGSDATELLDVVPDGDPGDVRGDLLADTLFYTLSAAGAELAPVRPDVPVETNVRLEAFVDAIAAKVHDNWLSFTTTEALEQLMVERSANINGARRVGRTELLTVEVGAPLEHHSLEPSVRRVLLELRSQDRKFGTSMLPAIDEILPAPIMADALAEDFSWALLEEFLARTAYPELKVSSAAGRVTVHRGALKLGELEPQAGETQTSALHRTVGWVVFQQELWGLPDWSRERFYTDQSPGDWPPEVRRVDASHGTAVVEISEDLPGLVGAEQPVDIEVTLAGVPFMVVRVKPAGGSISPARTRAAINRLGRYELCRLAVREGLLIRQWPDDVPLRARLREQAVRRRAAPTGARDSDPGGTRGSLLSELVPSGRRALVVGRRAGATFAGAGGQTALIPIAARQSIVESATRSGQEMIEFGDGDTVDMAVYAPFMFHPGRIAVEEDLAPNRDSVSRIRRYVRGARLPRIRRSLKDAPSEMTTRLPILMYHRVSPESTRSERRWTVTPAELEEQLAFLREHGYRSVDIEEWADAGSQDRGVPGRRVLLTFDDGYTDFAENALPLLDQYGFRAELFVVTGHIGGKNSWEAASAGGHDLMDWQTITSLPREIVKVGSHTQTHPLLTALSSEGAASELIRSRVMLEDRLGCRISSIAYPYGPAGGAIQKLAAAAGYDFGYTTYSWRAYVARHHLALPRLEVAGGGSLADFAQMLSSG